MSGLVLVPKRSCFCFGVLAMMLMLKCCYCLIVSDLMLMHKYHCCFHVLYMMPVLKHHCYFSGASYMMLLLKCCCCFSVPWHRHRPGVHAGWHSQWPDLWVDEELCAELRQPDRCGWRRVPCGCHDLHLQAQRPVPPQQIQLPGRGQCAFWGSGASLVCIGHVTKTRRK